MAHNGSSDRNVEHPYNPTKSKDTIQIFVPVNDEIYKERFDYELLDAEPIRLGLRKGFRITCIPFITYGINKGDVVLADSKGHIKSLLRDDGQYGYRISYPDFSDEEKAHVHVDRVLGQVREAGFEVEAFNHKLSAVNAVNRQEAIKAEILLADLVSQGQIVDFDSVRK